jgi:hypothetical protein
MHALLLSVALVTAGPVQSPSTRVARLSTYIVRINPKAADYSERLAGAILGASRRHGLDPHLMAAICWSESYFQLEVDGSSGERGPWQLLRRLDILQGAWNDTVAAFHGLPDYPDAFWAELPVDDRLRALEDPVLSTYMAAVLVAWHRTRCDYPTTATCYARYNSGGPRVRWGYVKALSRRAAHVRRAVDADIP